jgi:hypothetical protein
MNDKSNITNSPPSPVVPNHVIIRLAAAAQVCPATVRKVLNGAPTRAMGRLRVLRALEGLDQESRP